MNTARFLKYVLPFCNIMHERVRHISGDFIVNFEHILHTFLVFLLLTLNVSWVTVFTQKNSIMDIWQGLMYVSDFSTMNHDCSCWAITNNETKLMREKLWTLISFLFFLHELTDFASKQLQNLSIHVEKTKMKSEFRVLYEIYSTLQINVFHALILFHYWWLLNMSLLEFLISWENSRCS